MTKRTSTDLSLYQSIQTGENSLDKVARMGAIFAGSGMFGCTRAEQGMVLAMACLTHRLSPLEVANKYHIIDGMLSKRAGAALAEFKAMGGEYEWIKTGQEQVEKPVDRVALGRFSLDGKTLEVAFSMRDAMNAGLVREGSAWTNYPWKMLRARVVSDALGMLAPEIYFGVAETDDAPDFSNGKSLFQESETEKPTPKNEPKNQPEIIDAEVINSNAPNSKSTNRAERSASPIAPNNVQPDAKAEDSAEKKTQPATEQRPEKKPTPAASAQPPVIGDRPKNAAGKAEVDQVRKICRSAPNAARFYLISQGWLKEGQDFDFLLVAHVKQILRYPKEFMQTAVLEYPEADAIENGGEA